jgi:3-methyladenine DNA glycosylase AlkD
MIDPQQRADAIVAELKAMGNPANVAGMARYGIRSAIAFGVPSPVIRARARSIGRDHDLALALWESGALEARALAGLVDDPARVTRGQMERWARTFDSWAVVDATCSNLFDRTPLAREKALAWSRRTAEHVKRAGFVLMAAMAVHDKRAPDELFREFLPLIEAQAADGRNLVKKGASASPAARWVASDALRELTNPKTVERIERKTENGKRKKKRN